MEGNGGAPAPNRKPAALNLAGLLALLLGGISVQVARQDTGPAGFMIGDCPYYASAAISLWEDGDLDLGNQLRGGPAAHQEQVAVAADGALVPKHPILMPVVSVPFYALFGVRGFLLFNVAVLMILGAVAWETGRLYGGPGMAAAATLIVFCGSFLREYVYNYSPDLFSTLLLLAGILLILKRRPLAGGAFLGISVLAKQTNLFVAAIVGVFLLFRSPRKEAARAALAMAPGIAAWMLVNLALFGDPTVTGYDRTLILRNGVAGTFSHREFFDAPLLQGMIGQLVAPRVGLLATSPLLLLAVPGLVGFLRKHPWDATLCLGISEFLFLLFSTYSRWSTSHYGNRFLMLPVVLATVPIAFTLTALRERLRAVSFRHRAEATPESR